MIAKLGACLSTVALEGLESGLRCLGLEHSLIQSVDDTLLSLFNTVGGPAHTLDDVDARKGLGRLWQEWWLDPSVGPPQTYEEIEAVLVAHSSPTAISDALVQICAYYITAQFCRMFQSRLVAGVGNQITVAFLDHIEQYIDSCIHNSTVIRELRYFDWLSVDWRSDDGNAVADALLEQVMHVITTPVVSSKRNA